VAVSSFCSAYWRRGPVTMAAIAAVDVALWDIKARATGVPGLKSIYGIASNATLEGATGQRYDHEPAQRGEFPAEEDWDTRSVFSVARALKEPLWSMPSNRRGLPRVQTSSAETWIRCPSVTKFIRPSLSITGQPPIVPSSARWVPYGRGLARLRRGGTSRWFGG
jgi:hypothetical protein